MTKLTENVQVEEGFSRSLGIGCSHGVGTVVLSSYISHGHGWSSQLDPSAVCQNEAIFGPKVVDCVRIGNGGKAGLEFDLALDYVEGGAFIAGQEVRLVYGK